MTGGLWDMAPHRPIQRLLSTRTSKSRYAGIPWTDHVPLSAVADSTEATIYTVMLDPKIGTLY